MVFRFARMGDASPLRFLGCFGLGLCGRGHEGDQRIADGLLHRVLGGPVERHGVDDGADHNAAPHELPDGISHVGVVAAETIDPAHHKGVPSPELVEQAAALLPINEPGGDAGHTVIGDDVVDLESGRFGLRALMCGRLFDR